MNRLAPTIAFAVYAMAASGLGVVAATADTVSRTTVTTTTTGPAFGYQDGYWDQGHAWHAWANQDSAVTFQREHHAHYYGWRHDRDADMGWRDHDMYWNR